MDRIRQRFEVDANYEAFQNMLPGILPNHAGEFALMREREIIDFFDRPGAANQVGEARFADGIFSIQEVTDEPIDLGFFSHVAT